jgi:hypothetical protein
VDLALRRREFLALPVAARAADTSRIRLAALSTTYHTRSHTDNFVTRFLEGYWIHDKFYEPQCDVASLYMDQLHPADIGHKLAGAYGFPVKPTIADALTLGAGRLAVGGVILVGEHGKYPLNERHQILYPRFEFFRQVVAVFRKSERAAPVFVDKHLSYDWKKAKQMYDWSRELRFPMMAGSSLPVTFRRPEADHPLDTVFEDALMVGAGGGDDGGIFHYLETLQCFVERRRGGETGVRAVEYLRGDAVWRAAGQKRWSKELMQAALQRGEKVAPGRPEAVKNPGLALIEYNDGFRAAVLMLGGMVQEYLIAVRAGGRIDSTLCYIPIENSNNFSMFVHGITQMMTSGKPPYPVERTLLTTGMLARVMESGYLGGKRIDTPELAIRYRAPEKSYYAPGVGS